MSVKTLTCESSEIHVKYKITRFLDLPLDYDYELKSPYFFLSGAKWYLVICPYILTNTTHYVAVYLGRKHSDKDHHVIFKISVKRTDGSDIVAREGQDTFTEEKNTLGWAEFFERTSLSSGDILAPDGSLTIFCTVVTGDNMKDTAQPIQKDGTGTLSENLKDLYISRSFSDATIVVKGREFPVHRNILAARSKVFDSMFKLDMVEKQTGKVEIKDCDPDSFEKFLLFVYTGKLVDVSWSHTINLYSIADKYDLPNLKTECAQHLTNSMCVDSFCDVIHLAFIHKETKLLTVAEKFFVDNVKDILSCETWKTFLSEHPLLSNDLFVRFVNKNGQ